MSKILFPIALAAIIWSACTKSDAPDNIVEVPVFNVRIDSVNGDTTRMTAGQNGVYLFTNVKRGSDSVLVMSGAFADSDCPAGDCPGSVKFEFRNIHEENFVEPGFIFDPGQEWAYHSFLDSFGLQTVTIRWGTPDGSILSTFPIPQNQDSSVYFNILNSEPWEPNERGEKTWKMEVEFSCWMVDSMQGLIRRVSGDGMIAVGYR